jgi:hypothetical protein
MKYLIVKCEELGDQYECDANRIPVCITDNPSEYGLGYEVYELEEDNTFSLVKEYDTPLERGMALYYWGIDEDERKDKPTIIQKWVNFTRFEITEEIVEQIGFEEEEVNEIIKSIECQGSYAEDFDDKWLVLGEYLDDYFSVGY